MSAKHAMKTFAVVDLNMFIASSFTMTWQSAQTGCHHEECTGENFQ
jgi:hypothetical protein